MIMCIEQDKLAQPHHSMAHTNREALRDKLESVVQRIIDLGDTVLCAEEKKFQLKRDVSELQGSPQS